GVLTDGGAQGGAEALGVGSHLALGEDGELVLVHELHRVLDGDDVLVVGAVDDVDHRGEGGGLAGAGGAGDQHQPLLEMGEALDGLGQVELRQRHDRLRDDAEDGAAAVLLAQEVGAEAGEAFEAVGEVEVAAAHVVFPLGVARDLLQQVHQRVVRQDAPSLDRFERAMDADARLQARRQVQVGPLVFFQIVKQLVDAGHGRLSSYANFAGSSVCLRASSRVMTPFLSRSAREASSRHMPWAPPVCSTDLIWKVLFSRIRLPTALLTTRISRAGTRPLPSARVTKRWETTARSDSETMVRIWSCCDGGKTPRMRLTVRMALLVCRVARTRCPVSAAVRASEMVSRS